MLPFELADRLNRNALMDISQSASEATASIVCFSMQEDSLCGG
jgi:hypothetical protein